MKETIIEHLEKIDREGIDGLIEYLDECGFFTAPCSVSYHLAREGGLAQHSVNVMILAEAIAKAWLPAKKYKEMHESIVLCSLLHDLGKVGDFGKPEYVPNVLKSGEVSKTKPYEKNKDLLYVDHEIRSVKLCAMFIDLTEEEEHAILYHNGLYGNLKYAISGKETPLYMIIHFADMWASRVIEKEEK